MVRNPHATGDRSGVSRSSDAGRQLVGLSLAALGIAFGDIGTNPLYALRESFHGHGLPATHGNVLGVLSLITWALLLVVTVKYLVFVLRADNHGEGGVLALTALVTQVKALRSGVKRALITLGLIGTALLYGDGMITPAISVLSAVEGLAVATPLSEPYVVPITVAILVLLFSIQHRGTARVGRVFGFVMILWFGVLAVLGLLHVARQPTVLAALSPFHPVEFFADNGWRGFLILGSVFLVVTGGEALYADIGHFGKLPIRLPWFGLVLPALLLNYWGQGALVYGDPAAASNPFFLLAPAWGRLPLVVLATVAAVIASQALISGVFSLTHQAVQLGYSPRVAVRHTSPEAIGQVYVPYVNRALMLSCIALVLGFRSSSGLAAAYGIAVSTSMVITTVLLAAVMRARWGWRWPVVALLAGAFLTVDLVFFAGNVVKISDGGWVPLLVGAGVFTLMTTWKRGRQLLVRHLARDQISVAALRERLASEPPHRVTGTAIYMSGTPFFAPPALLYNLQHNKVLHERVLFLAIETVEIPRVPREERIQVTPLEAGMHQVVLRYGFMQSPHVPNDLRGMMVEGAPLNPARVTYFLARETVLPTPSGGMALWRERLFAFLAQVSQRTSTYFGLPPEQVVEFGAPIEI